MNQHRRFPKHLNQGVITEELLKDYMVIYGLIKNTSYSSILEVLKTFIQKIELLKIEKEKRLQDIINNNEPKKNYKKDYFKNKNKK